MARSTTAVEANDRARRSTVGVRERAWRVSARRGLPVCTRDAPLLRPGSAGRVPEKRQQPGGGQAGMRDLTGPRGSDRRVLLSCFLAFLLGVHGRRGPSAAGAGSGGEAAGGVSPPRVAARPRVERYSMLRAPQRPRSHAGDGSVARLPERLPLIVPSRPEFPAGEDARLSTEQRASRPASREDEFAGSSLSMCGRI
jgi:hypothetical protein